MTVKALVIDDDPAILTTVAEILESLGHQCDRADSMEAARQCLGSRDYTYILLDLEIPVRLGGLPRIQNGENLLREIVNQSAGGRKVPVIVMTAHGTDGPELAVEMLKKGADDYVTKPFKTHGDTLDRCILEALDRCGALVSSSCGSTTPIAERAAEKPIPATTFDGGVLKFFADRVELCGVDITSGPKSDRAMKAFGLFRQRRPNGTFAAYGCKQIAEQLGFQGGQNSGAGWIRRIRTRITNDLQAKANIVCGDEDVIQTTRFGYQLREWLSVQDDATPSGSEIQGHMSWEGVDGDPVNDPVNPKGSDPVNSDDPVNDPVRRRTWILHQVQNGRELRAPLIAAELACSEKTVKRDLEALEQEIEFVGAPKTGHYRLKKR